MRYKSDVYYCIIFTDFHRGGIMGRLREIREAANKTQKQVAAVLNVRNTAISQYERGDRQLDPGKICALCDYFNCTADYLLGRSDSPYPVISDTDAELLDAYKALPLAIRQAVDSLIAPYRRNTERKKPAESITYETGYKKVSEPNARRS